MITRMYITFGLLGFELSLRLGPAEDADERTEDNAEIEFGFTAQ